MPGYNNLVADSCIWGSGLKIIETRVNTSKNKTLTIITRLYKKMINKREILLYSKTKK